MLIVPDTEISAAQGGCSLSWHILLNAVIRIMRKTQPCGGSWSTKPRNTGGQKMTVPSRDIYRPFLHGVRPKVSTPGRPPGISSGKEHAQELRDWKSRTAVCRDTQVPRGLPDQSDPWCQAPGMCWGDRSLIKSYIKSGHSSALRNKRPQAGKSRMINEKNSK